MNRKVWYDRGQKQKARKAVDRMELSSFEIFLTVVEEMSFTRAAQRLYITQQSLSGHIRRLEEAYHVQLFRRRPALRLTPEGEAMVVYSRQMLASERAMSERFAELSETAAGSLTLGISHQRSGVFFPGIWSSYHPTHKNIAIHLREKMTNQLLEELQANQIDLMVGLDIPHATNLEVVPLAKESLYCVVNENLLQEYFPDDWQTMLARYKEGGVDLMELKALPMAIISSSNRLRAPVDALFNRNRSAPNIILETTEQTLLLQVACYGDGVSVLNPLSIYDAYRTRHTIPSYCHLLALKDMPEYDIQAAYRRDIDQPQYLLELVDAIRQEFEYYGHILERNLLGCGAEK